MCGVKIALFLPLNTLAISDAKRPHVLPSASTTYHFLSMVAGLAIKVFIDFPPDIKLIPYLMLPQCECPDTLRLHRLFIAKMSQRGFALT